MTTLLIPNRYEVMTRPLANLWDDWFNAFTPPVEFRNWLPPLDVSETEKAYEVTMELPGIDINKIDVSFDEGILTVKGEKTKEPGDGETCDCAERYYGSFERRLRISDRVDHEKIDARYKDGVLRLTLPKMEGTGVKKIAVH